MKKKRSSEEQIIRILREVESGGKVCDVARRHGVSETTIHRWRNRFKGMDQQQLRRLKELETENSRLKKIVAQQALDNDALRDLLGKEW